MTNDIALQIGFYSDSIDTIGNHVVFSKPLDSLTVKGVGCDSVIYDNSKNLKKIALPLNNVQAATSFAMLVNGKTDTLVVSHVNNDIFVSLECGCFTYHTIENISETAQLFDSVQYVEYEIGRVQTENIRMFWH